MDFIKIINFCTSQDTIKVNRQPTEREKTFAIISPIRGLSVEQIKHSYSPIIKRQPN